MKHRFHENCSVATGVLPSLLPTCYTTSSLTPKWVTAIGVVSFDFGAWSDLDALVSPAAAVDPTRDGLGVSVLSRHKPNRSIGHSLHHFIFPLNKKDCDNTRRTVFRMPRSTALSLASREMPHCSVLHCKLCDEEYFCSSIYLQQRDINNERGTQQKALVFISLYGFPKIFETILEMVYGFVLDSCNVAKKLETLYNEHLLLASSATDKAVYGTGICWGKPIQKFQDHHTIQEIKLVFVGREDGLGREEKCFLARIRLLEALEKPFP
ncbi:hypothetical protein TcBrA4_0139790 [Trypanosoma cruzi]|nr:hypothetical protein TcBrA4_0139790 [Trypanosoma cruzi]